MPINTSDDLVSFDKLKIILAAIFVRKLDKVGTKLIGEVMNGFLGYCVNEDTKS